MIIVRALLTLRCSPLITWGLNGGKFEKKITKVKRGGGRNCNEIWHDFWVGVKVAISSPYITRWGLKKLLKTLLQFRSVIINVINGRPTTETQHYSEQCYFYLYLACRIIFCKVGVLSQWGFSRFWARFPPVPYLNNIPLRYKYIDLQIFSVPVSAVEEKEGFHLDIEDYLVGLLLLCSELVSKM